VLKLASTPSAPAPNQREVARLLAVAAYLEAGMEKVRLLGFLTPLARAA
jgi:hypothetical protein